MRESDRNRGRLVEAMPALVEASLRETVAGKDYSTAYMLHDAM
jgi:hypothetical protein